MDADTQLEGGSKKKGKRKHKSMYIAPDAALTLNVGTSVRRRKLFEEPAPQPAGA